MVIGIPSAYVQEMTIAMRQILSYLPLATAALLSVQSYSADRGTLHADGVFAVRGAALAQAKVHVVPFGAAAYTLPMGTDRFVLDLPIDDTYLLSFERPGCPTKEVHFDTRVPVERINEDFTFRFKVTLEHMDEDKMFTYAGPVGFVRYMHELNDFGYETEYIVKVDEDLKERMKEYKVTGVDPKVIMPPTAALVITRPNKSSNAGTVTVAEPAFDEEVAPIVREVPRLVHLLGTSSDEQTIVAAEVLPLEREEIATVEARTIVVKAQEDEEPDPELLVMADLSLMELEVEEPTLNLASERTSMSKVIRDEELIVEPRMVRTIVRFIKEDGRVDEVLKVAHSYGATFYFDNGQSITEREYNSLLARY